MKPGETLVLCYHRVAEGIEDPFRLCVGPVRFRAQLEEISRSFVPSTLDDALVPAPRPRAVVTFDDGYGDNLWHALPIADALGVPITVFVTTGKLGDAHGFWWDRLAAMLRARPAGVREVALGIEDSAPLPLGRGTQEDLRALREALLPFAVPQIESALADVADRWQVASSAPADALPLTADELLALSRAGVAHVGAHTTDHLRLRSRSVADQHTAISGSKAHLEQMLGRRVRHFAYPFGGTEDFDDRTVGEVERAGFETASTTLPGTVVASTDPYRLPRRLVMDWGRARFRAQLWRWDLW